MKLMGGIMEKTNIAFSIFTSPDCTQCKEELPRIMRILKNRGYRYTVYDMTDVEGRTEAAMRGIVRVPHIVGEVEEILKK